MVTKVSADSAGTSEPGMSLQMGQILTAQLTLQGTSEPGMSLQMGQILTALH